MRRSWSQWRDSEETRIGSATRCNIQIHSNTSSNTRDTKLHAATLSYRERDWTSGGLPARDPCGESDPHEGRGGGGFWRAPPPPPRWRTSAKKQGVALTTTSPSRAAPRRAMRGARHAGRHRTGLYPGRLGKSVPTLVQCGFPGTTWTTAARTSPSESGRLGWSKGRATTCATSVRHPPFVRWPPI